MQNISLKPLKSDTICSAIDRITGALSVLKNLDQEWVMGLVFTHDFELCRLENDADIRAVNYHFMERYFDGKIYFDYAIKPGRCYSTNAKYLMQMVGIELIEQSS
jgi:DNA mismatch repair ATPase MutS